VADAPIPVKCAHRPTVGGYVIPFANVQLADGGCDFRSHHTTRFALCISQGRCQICGLPFDGLISLLGGPRQVESGLFDEPPMHPVCARYATQACPMIRGDRTHYATGPTITQRHRGEKCTLAGCECGGWVATPGTERASDGGDPAHEWWELQVREYAIVVNDTGRIWAVKPIGPVVRKRLVYADRPGYQEEGGPHGDSVGP